MLVLLFALFLNCRDPYADIELEKFLFITRSNYLSDGRRRSSQPGRCTHIPGI